MPNDTETWLYVRGRLPKDFLHSNSTIRFGVAYSVQDLKEVNDPDNDHTLFSFKCINRYDGDVVMDILHDKFYDAITYSSRVSGEHVDVVRLATELGVTDYNAESYADHIQLAKTLFANMVGVIKRAWPKKYHTMWGFMHSVEESPGQEIDIQLAEQMGMTEVETEAELMQQLSESQQQLSDSRQRVALLLQQLSELLPPC
jgi:hypothetical protein